MIKKHKTKTIYSDEKKALPIVGDAILRGRSEPNPEEYQVSNL